MVAGGCAWLLGGCMVARGHGCRGVCMVARGHAWLLGGAWLLGACMVAGGHALLPGGHVWLPGGHVWLPRGVHGCREGMHGCQGGVCGCRGLNIPRDKQRNDYLLSILMSLLDRTTASKGLPNKE